jgi:hypothetical protein
MDSDQPKKAEKGIICRSWKPSLRSPPQEFVVAYESQALQCSDPSSEPHQRRGDSRGSVNPPFAWPASLPFLDPNGHTTRRRKANQVG